MGAFFQTYARVLALRSTAFDELRLSNNSLTFIFGVFILVGLVANLGALSGIGQQLETPTLAERAYAAADRVEAWAGAREGFVGRLVAEPAASVSQWIVDFGATLESFEPPLGARPSRIIRLVGGWLASPLDLLAGWLTLILPVLLVAKLMGAGGNLRSLVTLSLLSAAPWILTLASSLPIPEGSAWLVAADGLRLLAVGWGIAILVKALALAGGVDQRRAITMLVVAAFVFYLVIPSVLITIGGLKLWLLAQLLR